ncbi:hypothetical protein M406DRAFT_73366 [Cryphonectria parasitica EP155]|uniref:Uncharacterized protein n=1 Tax=Cryphonectria parasitica (strain ATCC 38755 / EP155) TaxID=660469 RepID=A0A9P5CJA4_CRYP1|nr:uncharacterized protein M406DRAFT_73366 [Cryphonectria parasitica EP155]KAF3760908.1 hypothetical protein M406DRAFT_73366 [Cryphonectria parasitica EP155]
MCIEIRNRHRCPSKDAYPKKNVFVDHTTEAGVFRHTMTYDTGVMCRQCRPDGYFASILKNTPIRSDHDEPSSVDIYKQNIQNYADYLLALGGLIMHDHLPKDTIIDGEKLYPVSSRAATAYLETTCVGCKARGSNDCCVFNRTRSSHNIAKVLRSVLAAKAERSLAKHYTEAEITQAQQSSVELIHATNSGQLQAMSLGTHPAHDWKLAGEAMEGFYVPVTCYYAFIDYKPEGDEKNYPELRTAKETAYWLMGSIIAHDNGFWWSSYDHVATRSMSKLFLGEDSLYASKYGRLTVANPETIITAPSTIPQNQTHWPGLMATIEAYAKSDRLFCRGTGKASPSTILMNQFAVVLASVQEPYPANLKDVRSDWIVPKPKEEKKPSSSSSTGVRKLVRGVFGRS